MARTKSVIMNTSDKKAAKAALKEQIAAAKADLKAYTSEIKAAGTALKAAQKEHDAILKGNAKAMAKAEATLADLLAQQDALKAA